MCVNSLQNVSVSCKMMLLLLKCCFTSTETAGLLGTGAQDVHLDFHTALSSVYHDMVELLLYVHRADLQTCAHVDIVMNI